MRFEMVSLRVDGSWGKRQTYYSEQLDRELVDTFRPIVHLLPTRSVEVPGTMIPGLRVHWTPDPDGTALVTFYAGPDDEGMITTCAILPRGRSEHRAIQEGLRFVLEKMFIDLKLQASFPINQIPEMRTIAVIPWPNLKHMTQMIWMSEIEAALAGAYFEELAKVQS